MFDIAADTASIVLQQEGIQKLMLNNSGAAAIAVGLAAIGTGYAQRGIGSAAVGAVAEDSDNLVPGLIFTALPETLIIIALVTIFVV